MSKWILLRVWSNNEWYDGCEFALVEVDIPFMTKLLERLDNVRGWKTEDSELYNARYWDYSLEWYSHLGSAEDSKLYDIQDFLDGSMPDEFLLLDEKPEIPVDAVTRVEAPTVVVSDNDLYWTTYPKHSEGTRLNTAAIPRVLLEELLAAMKEKIH